MAACLKEAMCARDRLAMSAGALCSHRRDERNGRLLAQCWVINGALDVHKLFLNVQRDFGTGATAITEAQRQAWEELATPCYGFKHFKNPDAGTAGPAAVQQSL